MIGGEIHSAPIAAHLFHGWIPKRPNGLFQLASWMKTPVLERVATFGFQTNLHGKSLETTHRSFRRMRHEGI